MTSLVNQEKLKFSPSSRHYVPRGITAKSIEVSTRSVTDLESTLNIPRLFWPPLQPDPVMDMFFCNLASTATLFYLLSQELQSSLSSLFIGAARLKTTLPKYQSTRISYMQTGSANEMPSWEIQKTRREIEAIFSLFLITRKENWQIIFPAAKCLVVFLVTSFVGVKGSFVA